MEYKDYNDAQQKHCTLFIVNENNICNRANRMLCCHVIMVVPMAVAVAIVVIVAWMGGQGS
jgi:hypothetical protein